MPANQKTVLLAQDDEDSLDIFSTILRRSGGYRVLAAVSGEEAVRLAMEEAPDLIFTEAHLPLVDGWRLIDVLRGEPAHRRTRLVLLTSWVGPDQEERARAAGFDAYLPKPVDPLRLVEEAERLIGPPTPRAGRLSRASKGTTA